MKKITITIASLLMFCGYAIADDKSLTDKAADFVEDSGKDTWVQPATDTISEQIRDTQNNDTSNDND